MIKVTRKYMAQVLATLHHNVCTNPDINAEALEEALRKIDYEMIYPPPDYKPMLVNMREKGKKNGS